MTSDDVREAADRIGPYARMTPVFATEIGGRPVTLKLENLQVTGSFKFRGALNGVIARSAGGPARSRGDNSPSTPRQRGHVVAASGGNHGLGVAEAAKIMGLSATVYVGRTPDGRRAGRRRAVRRMAGRPGSGPPSLPGPLRREHRLASGVAAARTPSG